VLETAANYFNSANVLLDIGAHRGLFTRAANAFHPFERSICFEPNAGQNEAIMKNNRGVKCEVVNVALADKEDEVDYYLHQDDTMNSIVTSDERVLRDEFPWDQPEHMKSTTVKTTTLDGWLAGSDLPQDARFFLKIDTQGNELNVLKHGITALKRTEACLVEFMFFSPYEKLFSFYELVEFMEKQGFDCAGALSIQKRPSKKVSAVDFLFVRKED
jgi:FkbM family methyltransferase